MAERCHATKRLHASWRRRCVHVCACVRVGACVFTRVISGLRHLLRIFANALHAYTLYSHENPEFMPCGTISFLF